MFISFFSGKVMLFYGISLIMKEKSNASALKALLKNRIFFFSHQTDRLNPFILTDFSCGTKKGARPIVSPLSNR